MEIMKGKPNSKIIISVLARFFSVEFDGESPRSNSNRNTVKRTAENGQKILEDEDAAGIMSLVPGVKNLRPQNGLELNRAN